MKTVRRLKSVVKDILERYDLERLTELAMDNPRVISALISMTYDKDSVITWRAIEAVGIITGKVSKSNPEQAGEIVRRLLWSITEESGGIGWTAIEMLAEIVVNDPERFRHLVPLLLEFYDEDVFKDSVLYAVGRIGISESDLIDDYNKLTDIISDGLKSDDSRLRGLAAMAYKGLQEKIEGIDQNIITILKEDKGTFKIYEKGRLVDKKIGDVFQS